VSSRGPANRRFLAYIALILAAAALAWALLRAWNTAQEHGPDDAVAPASAHAAA
jgi:hypothetical protein